MKESILSSEYCGDTIQIVRGNPSQREVFWSIELFATHKGGGERESVCWLGFSITSAPANLFGALLAEETTTENSFLVDNWRCQERDHKERQRHSPDYCKLVSSWPTDKVISQLELENGDGSSMGAFPKSNLWHTAPQIQWGFPPLHQIEQDYLPISCLLLVVYVFFVSSTNHWFDFRKYTKKNTINLFFPLLVFFSPKNSHLFSFKSFTLLFFPAFYHNFCHHWSIILRFRKIRQFTLPC